jgi:hypothetical protein|tara:strand:+ start:1387 stop:1560 length:174 start_codon:yes stop_codon:yes gene_type:complete
LPPLDPPLELPELTPELDLEEDDLKPLVCVGLELLDLEKLLFEYEEFDLYLVDELFE